MFGLGNNYKQKYLAYKALNDSSVDQVSQLLNESTKLRRANKSLQAECLDSILLLEGFEESLIEIKNTKMSKKNQAINDLLASLKQGK